jgi:thiamine-phosphate pyrophosphorylase
MTQTNKPVVAIGGINLDNCRSILDCGVNSIAVVNEIFSSQDITQTVNTFNEILKTYEQK